MKRRARRRLVGAIALIVFVVIALPIVLDREPKQVSQDLTIQIPSQDSGRFSGRLAPVQPEAIPKSVPETPLPAAMTGSTDSVVKTEVKPESKADATIKVDAKAESRLPEQAPGKSGATTSAVSKMDIPVQKQSSTLANAGSSHPQSETILRKDTSKLAPSVPAAEGKPTKPVAVEQGFVVPLGVFTKADNIKQVRSKAAAAGLKTFSDPVEGSDRVRVRAGPFATREMAEQARDKLKSAGLTTGAVLAR